MILTLAAAALADPTWAVKPGVDLPLLAIQGALASGYAFRTELPPAWCSPRCDSDRLLAIDRWDAGKFDPGWGHASDGAWVAVMGGTAATLIVAEGPKDGVVDGVVVAESALAAFDLSFVVANATGRPRPYMYGDSAPYKLRFHGDSDMSFFSAHTSSTFAATVALATTLHTRSPRSPVPWIVLGTGVAGATFVGIARIEAGEHFPTDVLAGAAIGTGLGILVPELHARKLGIAVGPDTVGLTGTL
jgi:membrane-associated phospholipid phosphatase